MDCTFKPPAEVPQMPTRIPQASREINLNVSKHSTASVETLRDQRATATMQPDAESQSTPHVRKHTMSALKHRHAPRITIEPWDGSFSTLRRFINQLESFSFFHPAHSRDQMIWAISFFRGEAADEAGPLMAALLNDSWDTEVKENFGRTRHIGYWYPSCWSQFLYEYLLVIEEKVARRREWWIVKATRFIWNLLCGLLYCVMWLVMIVVIAALLIQVSGAAAENSALLWEWKNGRIVPTV